MTVPPCFNSFQVFAGVPRSLSYFDAVCQCSMMHGRYYFRCLLEYNMTNNFIYRRQTKTELTAIPTSQSYETSKYRLHGRNAKIRYVIRLQYLGLTISRNPLISFIKDTVPSTNAILNFVLLQFRPVRPSGRAGMALRIKM